MGGPWTWPGVELECRNGGRGAPGLKSLAPKTSLMGGSRLAVCIAGT